MAGAIVAVVAAVAGAAATSAVGAGFLGILAGSLVSGIIGFAGSAILGGSAKKPKFNAPSFQWDSPGAGRTQLVRQPITSWKLAYGRVAISGSMTFLHSKSEGGSGKNEFLYMVVPLVAHRCQGFVKHFLGDTEVVVNESGEATNEPWYRDGTRYVWIKTHLGADDQAADQMLVDECEGKWTAEHRLRGVCYAAIKLKYSEDVFPSGIPNYRAVLDAKCDIYDPRTETSGYTDNAILCVADYMSLSADLGGLGSAWEDLDEELVVAGANVCDEDVALKAGGTEARYRCWGVVDTKETPEDILEDLLSCCGGRIVAPGEKWRIYPAAYDAPALTIDESDLAGPLEVRPRRVRRELFNGVKGVFVSPDDDWQPVDYPAVTAAAYVAQDNGEEIWKDLPQPFTPSASQAQRLAKIELHRMRAQIVLQWPGKARLWRVAAWETVQVDNALLGWSGEVFRVTDRTMTEGHGVDLVLTEESPDIYAWNAAEEEQEVTPSPALSLPDPRVVPAPGGLAVSEELYVTTGSSGAKAKVVLTWLAAEDFFVKDYDVEFQPVGGEWQHAATTRALRHEIYDLAPGAYAFRVRGRNVMGGASAWTVVNQEIYGLFGAPGALTGLSVASLGNMALIRWTPCSELDVILGGRIVFRHSPALSGASWPESTGIGQAVPGSSSLAVLPLKPGTYLAKVFDAQGVGSDVAAVTTSGATALEYGPVLSIAEGPDWLGDMSGVVVDDDGNLKLGGIGLVDDIPDFDAVSDLDAFGGIAASGTYGFASGMDFTTARRVRLMAVPEAFAVNILDLVDERETLVDTWEDFDGTSAAPTDCHVEYRETDDDPASPSAVWSAWQRLDACEAFCRGVEFRAALVSGDQAYNIIVPQLTVHAEEVV